MNRLSNQELRGMAPAQLIEKANELRKNLLELRLNSATTHVKSFASEQKSIKRAIAQVLTHLRQKEQALTV